MSIILLTWYSQWMVFYQQVCFYWNGVLLMGTYLSTHYISHIHYFLGTLPSSCVFFRASYLRSTLLNGCVYFYAHLCWCTVSQVHYFLSMPLLTNVACIHFYPMQVHVVHPFPVGSKTFNKHASNMFLSLIPIVTFRMWVVKSFPKLHFHNILDHRRNIDKNI